MSVGEKQTLEIISIYRRENLILDEPTAVLDAVVIQKLSDNRI
jgi:ABC-type uncharacterized transport system ATPase subunit